jgi:hypothetical protein
MLELVVEGNVVVSYQLISYGIPWLVPFQDLPMVCVRHVQLSIFQRPFSGCFKSLLSTSVMSSTHKDFAVCERYACFVGISYFIMANSLLLTRLCCLHTCRLAKYSSLGPWMISQAGRMIQILIVFILNGCLYGPLRRR